MIRFINPHLCFCSPNFIFFHTGFSILCPQHISQISKFSFSIGFDVFYTNNRVVHLNLQITNTD